MKEMPFWLRSGPDMTGTATGIGAAREIVKRERKERRAEVFMKVARANREARVCSVEGLQ